MVVALKGVRKERTSEKAKDQHLIVRLILRCSMPFSRF